jgi:hypothetical protein
MDIQKIISTLADIMTIFGVGGFFTWSFVKQSVQERDVSDIGVSMFAYSIKFFLTIISQIIIFALAYCLHFFLVLFMSGNYTSADGIWNPEKTLVYAITYATVATLWIPLAILTASSFFAWSTEPFHRLFNKFKIKPMENKN